MRTSLFDYDLPEGLIAQEPLARRDRSRLMLVRRSDRDISHHGFIELPDLLAEGDCAVVNSSRVFPGRLEARKESGGRVELLLLERLVGDTWLAMTRGAGLRPGARLSFAGSPLFCEVLQGPERGRVTVGFQAPQGGPDVGRLLIQLGEVPLPPYIHRELDDPERYQTVYAERELSAAAPTAGLHFTRELLERMKERGIAVSSLELAVGMDTFVPVRTEEVERHRIHSEWFSVTEGCARSVNEARDRGHRAVAVGTTVVRSLESAADSRGKVRPMADRTGLFITPGYRFRSVDALLTNFHFPRSTLLMLVCAFGGYDLIMEAYREAVESSYRFYSFGDAMLVI